MLPQVTIDGGRVHVRNVRDFTFRSATDFTPGYREHTYELAKLQRVWFVPLAVQPRVAGAGAQLSHLRVLRRAVRERLRGGAARGGRDVLAAEGRDAAVRADVRHRRGARRHRRARGDERRPRLPVSRARHAGAGPCPVRGDDAARAGQSSASRCSTTPSPTTAPPTSWIPSTSCWTRTSPSASGRCSPATPTSWRSSAGSSTRTCRWRRPARVQVNDRARAAIGDPDFSARIRA